MSLDQALAYRLPNGKTMGEASPEDLSEIAEFYENELQRIESEILDGETRQRRQANLDRSRDLREAVTVIAENNPELSFLK